MNRRIAVVVSQAHSAGNDARQQEEDLIARLMFESGLDTSVIPHLEHLADGSTGLLCLEGIRGDMILLTWLAPATAREILADRNVLGRFGKTQLTANDSKFEVSGGSVLQRERTIYLLQLDAAVAIDTYIEEIQRILEQATVRLVKIQDIATGSRTEDNRTAEVANVQAVVSQTDSDKRIATKSTNVDKVRANLPAESHAGIPAETDDDLDRLLDELDESDL